MPSRILIVDDHVETAEGLAELVGLWGHDTRAVHNGQAALDAAQQWHPDVILLDITLPDLDGYEVARRLRAGPHGSQAVFVALTGHATDAAHEASAAAGFDHHLAKPVDFELLERLLAGMTSARGA